MRRSVATRCVKSWPLSDGSTENAKRRSGRKPGSRPRRFIRLRVKRPAPIRRRSDSATCATTSPLRRRKCPVPPTTDVASLLSVGARSARLARRAGTSPKPTPVSTESAEGEEAHPPVGRGRQRPGRVLEGQRADERLPHPVGELQADEPAGERQHQALHEVQAHQAQAARAEGQPHRDLLLARRGARQEQARHVGARDQEHEADHAHQHDERRARLVAQARGAAPARQDLERLLEEAGPQALRGPRQVREVLLEELRVDHVGGGPGLGDRDAVLEAGHADEPARAPVADALAPGRLDLLLHRRAARTRRPRSPRRRRGSPGGATPTTVIGWLLTVTDWPTTLASPPKRRCEEAVTQHDDRVPRGSAVVLAREEPAVRGAQAEHLEERAGDHVAVDVVGLALHREVDGRRVVTEGPLEGGRPVAQAVEHRLGHRHDRVALVAGPARERPGGGEHHQAVGPLDGKRRAASPGRAG